MGREQAEILRGAIALQAFRQQLSLPEDPYQFIAEMNAKFKQISNSVDSNINKNSFAEIVDDTLSLSRDKAAPKNEEVEGLKRSLRKLLPRIKLPDLLIEVDRWTHFTRHFASLGGLEPRTISLQKSLFANFMAQVAVLLVKPNLPRCNIGLVNMADSTPDITYRQLFHVSTWYINDDTLRAEGLAKRMAPRWQ